MEKVTKDIFGNEIDALLDIYLETNSGEVVLINKNLQKVFLLEDTNQKK